MRTTQRKLALTGALIVATLAGCAPSLNTEAKDYCERAVTLTLKSPASAKFDRSNAQDNGASIMVRGTVHSQNSFGALMPTSFWCEFEKQNNQLKLQRTCVAGITGDAC